MLASLFFRCSWFENEISFPFRWCTRIFFKPANLLSSWWRFGNQHWLIIRSTAANDQSLMKMIRLFATVRVRVLELAELVSKCSENCAYRQRQWLVWLLLWLLPRHLCVYSLLISHNSTKHVEAEELRVSILDLLYVLWMGSCRAVPCLSPSILIGSLPLVANSFFFNSKQAALIWKYSGTE